MTQQYNPDEFKSLLEKKLKDMSFLKCPFCGNDQFTTTESLATILISKNRKDISLGPCIPAGMVIKVLGQHLFFV